MANLSLFLSSGEQVQGEPGDIQARLREASGPYWLSITAPGEEELEWLGSVWGFHPLTLDDCRTYNPRSKLEEYPGYLFLVLHEAALAPGGIEAKDIQIYFSRDYLISVHRDPSEVLERISHAYHELSKGADFLLYRVLDAVTQRYFGLIAEMDERIELVEEPIVARQGRQVLRSIFLLRKDLVAVLRLVGPFREAVRQITDRDDSPVLTEHQLYFRDVVNSLAMVHEMIETQRDLATGALETYLSAVSNNLNEVMKRLTLITTVFMPVSFIAAVGGMNFIEFIPFNRAEALAVTVALIVLLPVGMLAWFKTKRWI